MNPHDTRPAAKFTAKSLFRPGVYGCWTLIFIPLQLVANTIHRGLAGHTLLVYWRVSCRIIGFSVQHVGEISRLRPTLFVSNHSSYLDIMVLGAVIPGCFVAKKEVADWPVFGPMSKLQRTVYVARRSRDVADERDILIGRLKSRDNLILLPEGTSNDGVRVLRFRSSFLSVAEQPVNGSPLTVQPVGVAYTRLNGLPMERRMRPFFAWYGNMEMAAHLLRVAGLGRATVVVQFFPPVTIAAFSSRKQLSEHCRKVIASGVSTALHGRPTDATALARGTPA